MLSAPRWMRSVLLAAAAYNLLWGGFAIIAPVAIFRWAELEPMPLYPEFWQCIGMIVGVYGIGYAIAAGNPYVHWPIVLVGLLGKIFGPIGFVQSVMSGRLPAAMGWTILTNDLVWWIPFLMILWGALRASQCAERTIEVVRPTTPIAPLNRTFSQFGSSLLELSRQQPVLVVFLRHSGCTFCREALADVAKARPEIEASGTLIALVHMGYDEPSDLLEKHGLDDLHCFRDPSCALYDTFGLKLGGPNQLLGPWVIWRGLGAFLRGHRIGRLNGNAFRMPGVILLSNGNITRAYRHRSAADRPDYQSLAQLPDQEHSADSVSTAAATA